MESYKREFIEFMAACDVLLFGDFVTKSGRRTPYFIDTGRYRTGRQLSQLGHFYARAIMDHVGEAVDVIYGPAYKGIPLVVATAIALSEEHGRSLAFCFNRKEVKDHGEGGRLVGHEPRDGERVVIVEDVTTAGTSARESVALLRASADVRFAGLVVAVDRMERGKGDRSAIMEIREDLGIPVFPIVTMDEIVTHLHNRSVAGRVVIDDEIRARIDAYRLQHGVRVE
ncbi:MAG: orotate phosphoribosyltransferase [Vicinamibacteria bacterium]|nr:orotate phosphoribosyltransferase [Vicinamibacteria bacterium]